MIQPLLKHVTQPVEAPFLDAYETVSSEEKKTVSCVDNDYIATMPLSGNTVVFKAGGTPGVGEVRVCLCIDLEHQESFPLIRVGERIKVNYSCFIAKLDGTYAAGQTATIIKGMSAGDEYVATESFRIVILAMKKSFSVELTYDSYIEAPITYFGLLVDKDDKTKVSRRIPSKIHVIDETRTEGNCNAFVYFDIEDQDTHDLEEGTKLIWEIVQENEAGEYIGCWTSKTPAFKVVETSIDHE